jgi:hypothetical protein
MFRSREDRETIIALRREVAELRQQVVFMTAYSRKLEELVKQVVV